MAREVLKDPLDSEALIRYIYATAMKSVPPSDSAQAMQRVRVGLTGLTVVMLVIGAASTIFSSASNDPPISVTGANQSIVANPTDGNTVLVEKSKEEPLAELGVAPSTGSTETVNAAEIAKREEARRQAEAAGKR